MIKKNLPIIIISTLVTLLPAFTGTMVPVFLAAIHLICLLVTMKDPGNQKQNPKAMRMVYFICPFVSIYFVALNYAIKSGMEFGIDVLTMILIGILFVVIGNYLPKCKQNATIGIKVPWAYTSEENWNKTHRLGGKLWVVSGLILMLSALLPESVKTLFLIGSIFVMVIVPAVYSYMIYRRELKEGKAETTKAVFGKTSKVSVLFLAAVLIFVAIMMFTGNIEYTFREDSLTIEADYWEDRTVSYDKIEGIEYRENGVSGTRTAGFGSAKLLMGTFENDEFGYYTRYTYRSSDSAIVVSLPKGRIVVSGKNDEETNQLYIQLLERIR